MYTEHKESAREREGGEDTKKKWIYYQNRAARKKKKDIKGLKKNERCGTCRDHIDMGWVRRKSGGSLQGASLILSTTGSIGPRAPTYAPQH